MRSAFAAVALVFSAAAAFAQIDACGEQGRALRAQSARYTVPFTMSPQPAVGRHFAVSFVVCGRNGPVNAESVNVDARMPSHGHGMNYRASVTALGNGRYRAEGLMFHMPGEWELAFVVREGGASERVTQAVVLR